MHIKIDNKGMQDIKEIERMSNRKHKGMFRGSSTLALHPRLRHTKDFHYARSQWISPRCRNTYKPSDSLVPYTRKLTSSPRPHLKPRVHNRTLNHHDHTCPFPQSTRMKSLGDLNTLITNKSSHYNTPKDWMINGCSSVCVRKTRKRMVEENSRNHF